MTANIRVLTKGDIFNNTLHVGDESLRGFTVIGNPVNCVGVMGKGLALEFKKRFPHAFSVYEKACAEGALKEAGDVVLTKDRESGHASEYCSILLIATKTHWKDKSRPEAIRKALRTVRTLADANSWEEVKLPALGCGLGGLRFEDTLSFYEEAFEGSPCEVTIYNLG